MLSIRNNCRRLCKTYEDSLKLISSNVFISFHFSSKGRNPKVFNETISVPTSDEKESQWNEHANWELLGIRSYRFNLPGNVGLSPEKKFSYKKVSRPKKAKTVFKLPDSSYMRHMEIVAQIASLAGELSFFPNEPKYFHCQAVDCPYLLRNEVIHLFPNANIGVGPLTAVCISLRCRPKNIDKDWKRLVQLYEETSRRVCSKLSHSGHWADYPTNVVLPADPSSSAQIEAAHNLTPPGVKVQNIAGCILLVHAAFGESRVLGWLFTTAPYDDSNLARILKEENV